MIDIRDKGYDNLYDFFADKIKEKIQKNDIITLNYFIIAEIKYDFEKDFEKIFEIAEWNCDDILFQMDFDEGQKLVKSYVIYDENEVEKILRNSIYKGGVWYE